MPPKRKAGTTTAKAKAHEKNGETEHSMDVEEKVSSEQFQEVEASKKKTSPKRPRRAAAAVANNVYSEEPPEKVTKVDKKPKGKPEKVGKVAKKGKQVEDDDTNPVEEPTEKVVKRTEKKGKGEKKVDKKEEPVKNKKENVANEKEETKVKEKKGKGKSIKNTKSKEDVEENGKEEAEKSEKVPLNPSSTKWEKLNFSCSKKNGNGKNYNLKISCWNIGGLKSWVKKDCTKFLDYENPDILCLQETKCNEVKIPDEMKVITDYKQYWCGSDKEGYAGVGLLTKKEPINVTYGIDEADQDVDGRCITAEFDDYYVVCVYVPNAGRKLVTLPKRLEWNKAFKSFIKELDKKKPVIICGDMNVSHNEIDLARPKSNTKNAGFTQEERDGMQDFLDDGYVDTFRELYPDKADMYTFWTYISNARSKNIGWRLDYFIISERIKKNVCDNVIRSEVLGSDHCPITLFINL